MLAIKDLQAGRFLAVCLRKTALIYLVLRPIRRKFHVLQKSAQSRLVMLLSQGAPWSKVILMKGSGWKSRLSWYGEPSSNRVTFQLDILCQINWFSPQRNLLQDLQLFKVQYLAPLSIDSTSTRCGGLHCRVGIPKFSHSFDFQRLAPLGKRCWLGSGRDLRYA